MMNQLNSMPGVDIITAAHRLKGVVKKTPLCFHPGLSTQYNCKVYLKREDLQVTRSYKLRGAYNKMSGLTPEELKRGLVCASAGNHAQGFAYSCKLLNARGVVFMPVVTPSQKIRQTKMFGGSHIEVILFGDTFDDCAHEARLYTTEHQLTFIPPFDDWEIIEGQGTIAVELLEDLPDVDYVFVPVGGGGLAAGLGIHLKRSHSTIKLIGVEPAGAASMTMALAYGQPVLLNAIDRFVDGAAVKQVGTHTFSVCSQVLDDMLCVPEGEVCAAMLKLYNDDALVVEPAGALSIAALDQYAAALQGKTVVCIISGGNNDIERMQEIKERALLYRGLKHYFIVQFAQRPGALKQFVTEVLGPDDDIVRFEFMKKNNRESGPAFIGIEIKAREDYKKLLDNMDRFHMNYLPVNEDGPLFGYFV